MRKAPLLLLFGLLAANNYTQAASVPNNEFQGYVVELPTIHPELPNQHFNHEMNQRSLRPEKKPRKSEEAVTYSVTPVIIDNQEAGIKAGFMQWAIPRNGHWAEETFNFGEECMPFNLAPDTYDFVFYYSSKDAIYLVVKEGVVVDSDMEITADYMEAVNLLECSFTLPDGSKIQPPVYDFATQTLTPGNIVMGACEYIVNSKNGIFTMNATCRYQAAIIDGEYIDNVSSNKVYVSPNNVLEVTWLNMVGIENGPTMIAAETSTDCTPISITSSIDSFTEFEVSYGDSFNNEAYDGYHWATASAKLVNKKNGRGSISFSFYNGTKDNTWYSSHILFKPNDSEFLGIWPILENEMLYDEISDNVFGIIGPVCVGTEDPNEFVSMNNLNWTNYYDVGYIFIKDNPWMKYTINAGTPQKVGHTVPGIVILRTDEGDNECSFVCRDGALRKVDRPAAKIEIKNNDDVVCTDINNINRYLYDDEWEPIEYQGSWDYNFSVSNMLVENEESLSTLHLHIDKDNERKSTLAVPQVQFRNISGEMTEQFTSKDEMIIYVEAGSYSYFREFSQDPVGWTHYYESVPAEEIKIEISPRGSSEFIEVPIQKLDKPENCNYIPAGNTYLLKGIDIDIDNPEGWYDLRVSLKDKDQTLEQLISPAFKIERNNGINTVTNSESEVFVKDGKLVIPTGSRVFIPSGQEVSVNSASQGIYFIVTKDKAYKVIL